METRAKCYAPMNMLLGVILLIMGYVAVVMYHYPPDLTSCGIWGGMFLIGAGVATIKKHSVLILPFAVLSTLASLVIMATYIWSVLTINLDGGRTAQDVLFIVFGFIAFITNSILIHDAKDIHREENKHHQLQEEVQPNMLPIHLQTNIVTNTQPEV